MFEIVASVGMRFSILLAVCVGTTCDQAWVVRESQNLVGRVGSAGLKLFAATDEHTIGVYSVRLLPRTV